MLVNIQNNLTDDQKKELLDKIEILMSKYSSMSRSSIYFAGVVDGMNHICKLINEIDDDYNYD